MDVVNRAALAAPSLPKRTVDAPAIGGAVIVRGLMLTERLAIDRKLNALIEARDAAPAGAAYDATADVNTVLPMLLAMCVCDAQEQLLWTEAQWQIFGGQHRNEAVTLFNVAWELNGLSRTAAEKN